MFGKTGVFCDGAMLGMVTENTLYFRVDDDNRPTFEEACSFPPLNYAKKGVLIDLSFWRAPDRLFDDLDELLKWARAALAAAHWIALKRRRRRQDQNRRDAEAGWADLIQRVYRTHRAQRASVQISRAKGCALRLSKYPRRSKG